MWTVATTGFELAEGYHQVAWHTSISERQKTEWSTHINDTRDTVLRVRAHCEQLPRRVSVVLRWKWSMPPNETLQQGRNRSWLLQMYVFPSTISEIDVLNVCFLMCPSLQAPSARERWSSKSTIMLLPRHAPKTKNPVLKFLTQKL